MTADTLQPASKAEHICAGSSVTRKARKDGLLAPSHASSIRWPARTKLGLHTPSPCARTFFVGVVVIVIVVVITIVIEDGIVIATVMYYQEQYYHYDHSCYHVCFCYHVCSCSYCCNSRGMVLMPFIVAFLAGAFAEVCLSPEGEGSAEAQHADLQ